MRILKAPGALSLLIFSSSCGDADDINQTGLLWETWGVYQADPQFSDVDVFEVLEDWRDQWIDLGLADPRDYLRPVMVTWIEQAVYELPDGRDVRGHMSDPAMVSVGVQNNATPGQTALVHELTHAYFAKDNDPEGCKDGDADHLGDNPKCWGEKHELAIDRTDAFFRGDFKELCERGDPMADQQKCEADGLGYGVR